MIPRNIIQFWHDLNDIPEIIENAMNVTASNNPNYTIVKADDAFMLSFLDKHYASGVLELYKKNKVAASRSDIARLVLLYEYGGFYIDASMELQKNLDDLYEESHNLLLVQRDDSAIYKTCPKSAHIINGFIAAPKQSDFIKWCIDQVLINLMTGCHNNRVNLATGPSVINQATLMFPESRKKILSFSSLSNNFFIYRRVRGVNNSWVCSQSGGIISPSFYKKNSRQYRKLWLFKRISFHFSFGFLITKNRDR